MGIILRWLYLNIFLLLYAVGFRHLVFIAIGFTGMIIWIFVTYRIEDSMYEKKLYNFAKQFEKIPIPDDMDIEGDTYQCRREEKKHQIDFVVSAVIRTHKTAEEIYDYFNGFSYKSVNRIFKTEPTIAVNRSDTPSGWDKSENKNVYTVIFTDKCVVW